MLGWEPAEVTTYEYDGAGRVVRAVTVREPEFSHLDRKWLLDSLKRAREPRGSHGWPISEATARENMGRFVVPQPTTDFAKKALVEAQEKASKEHGEDAMKYLLFQVELEG